MRIVALKERSVADEALRSGDAVEARWRDDSARMMPLDEAMAGRLRSLEDGCFRFTDRSGRDVQVLSLTAPGVRNLQPADARDVARRVNDLIAATVKARAC